MRIAINSILAFVLLLLNYITSTFESASDGWDVIGFPFVFYRHTEAKIDLTIGDRDYFSLKNMLLNLGLYFILFIVLNLLATKYIKGKKLV